MEGPLALSDQELTYYHNLFNGCDVDGSGKIPGFKALELFKAAGLTTDILSQISELCGAKRLGHYGRSQFFVALKLIVAAQNGLDIRLDNINLAKEILPSFKSPPNSELITNTSNITDINSTGDSMKTAMMTGQLPPPPAKKHGRNSSGQWRGVVNQHSEPGFNSYTQVMGDNVVETEVKSPNTSPPMSPITKVLPKQQSSPGVLNSPHHTSNNISGKNTDTPKFVYTTEDHAGWANFDDDDSKGLLGTGHKKLSDHLDLHQTFDSSSISSETDSLDDVWSINDEQREYYVQQFKTMQTNLSGVITGNIAKEFFEKSKLPVHELSKIWQLSDVNRDGALSVEEFCTAMHLVVLRRNDIELPDDLPVSLMPYSALLEADEPFAANLPKGATIKRASPHSPADKQWASHITNTSPLATDVSSPGIKPVKFEFKPPDPGVLHPVAVRMSPTGQPISDTPDRNRALSDPALYEPDADGEVTPSKPRAFTYNTDVPSEPLQSRPRPVSKIISADRGGVSSSQGAEGSLPPPPQVPPRPSQHSRSVSVDMKIQPDHAFNAPPAVPPRASPKDSHAFKWPVSEQIEFNAIDSDRNLKQTSTNLKRFDPIISSDSLSYPAPGTTDTTYIKPPTVVNNFLDKHRRTISLDYRQLGPMGGGTQPGINPLTNDIADTNSKDDDYSLAIRLPEDQTLPSVDETMMGDEDTAHKEPVRQGSRDHRDYTLAIRTHRECNKMLMQVNSELNQELQEVMEQRIALEIQLEHLRPFYS